MGGQVPRIRAHLALLPAIPLFSAECLPEPHLPAQRSEQTISQTELQPQLTAAAKSDLERTIYYFHNGAVNCWRSDDCPGLASVDASAPEQPR
jgi:hypothetical protein